MRVSQECDRRNTGDTADVDTAQLLKLRGGSATQHCFCSGHNLVTALQFFLSLVCENKKIFKTCIKTTHILQEHTYMKGLTVNRLPWLPMKEGHERGLRVGNQRK